jgi:hypothetical protein
MRCPSCHAETPEGPACASCGRPLPPPRRKPGRKRGVDEVLETPFSEHVEPANRPAMRAFRVAVYALVPGAGLVLGPLAVVLGALAGWRGKSDPAFSAPIPARAAVVLGALVTLTNWAGLLLMIVGWRSAGG